MKRANSLGRAKPIVFRVICAEIENVPESTICVEIYHDRELQQSYMLSDPKDMRTMFTSFTRNKLEVLLRYRNSHTMQS